MGSTLHLHVTVHDEPAMHTMLGTSTLARELETDLGLEWSDVKSGSFMLTEISMEQALAVARGLMDGRFQRHLDCHVDDLLAELDDIKFKNKWHDVRLWLWKEL